MMLSLSTAKIGHLLTIDHVAGARGFRRRLMELGLVPGTRIEVVGQAPFGGPLELLARGCSLSIRREDAELVAVRAEGTEREAALEDDVLGHAVAGT